MAKPNVLQADTKLYSPAEPKGRVFLTGEPWPGDAWSDRAGGDEVGKGTVTQALTDLKAANAQADGLRQTLESQQHDLAQIGRERDQALAALGAAQQAASDAATALATAENTASELTVERDAARSEAASQRARAEALDAALTEAKAKIAPLDGDDDGSPGGSKRQKAGA